MKRSINLIKIVVCFLLIFLSFGLFALKAGAGDEEGESLPREWNDFLDAIPEDQLEQLPDSIYENQKEDLNQTAQKISTPGYILGLLLEGFGAKLNSILPTAALLIALLFIASILYILSANLGSGIGKATELAVRLVSFCVITAVSISSISRLSDYFSSLFQAVAAFLPLSAALYAMGGNLTAAASGTVTLSAILAVCQFVCSYTVIPVFGICLALSSLSVFDGVGGFVGTSLSATVKKHYLTALSFIMMILTVSLGAQNILAVKADNAAMRGIKFAVSGFVPVTGGTVSSTLGTLRASVELLRGSVGVIGIVVIILMLLPVALELALMRGVFGVCSFLAGMLSCTGEQKLLNEAAGLYGFLEGAALLCSVIFIIAMAVFASISAAV